MQVQFVDGWGKEFYCSAYAEFDENMVALKIFLNKKRSWNLKYPSVSSTQKGTQN